MPRLHAAGAALAILFGLSGHAFAGKVVVEVFVATAEGEGASVGTVTFLDSQYGLLVAPNLHDLTVGPHATHIHENPSCAPTKMGDMVHPAGAAGGHYDPGESGYHTGPYGNGHLGDLPNLYVEADGTATIPVLAPRVKAADLKGRSLMIHAEADRYDAASDHQHSMGGPRMYCGVIAPD